MSLNVHNSMNLRYFLNRAIVYLNFNIIITINIYILKAIFSVTLKVFQIWLVQYYFQSVVFYVVSDDPVVAKVNLSNVDANIFFMGIQKKSLTDGRDLVWDDQIGNSLNAIRIKVIRSVMQLEN